MSRPVHFEIHAADTARAMRFYQRCFGWQFTQFGELPYWTIKTGESGPGIDGGLLPRQGGAPEDGAAVNAWVCTLGVGDLPAALATVEAEGGRLVVETMAIAGVGQLAYVKDTEGNILGLLEPDRSEA